MKSTFYSAQQLRAWLETNQGTIKEAVLAQPQNTGQSTGLNFITDYLYKAGVGFDQDDYDCQRIIAVAGSWVTRWRLGYE